MSRDIDVAMGLIAGLSAKLLEFAELIDALALKEVPCCGQLAQITRTALANVGKVVPVTVIEIGLDGVIRRRDP